MVFFRLIVSPTSLQARDELSITDRVPVGSELQLLHRQQTTPLKRALCTFHLGSETLTLIPLYPHPPNPSLSPPQHTPYPTLYLITSPCVSRPLPSSLSIPTPLIPLYPHPNTHTLPHPLPHHISLCIQTLTLTPLYPHPNTHTLPHPLPHHISLCIQTLTLTPLYLHPNTNTLPHPLPHHISLCI
ncbi:hypothetical protein ACOMHN_038470 [Nucella lapillus]